jgi:cytochrome c biogenesis protein CcmG/thiol:disulfide interchange protein DsbE
VNGFSTHKKRNFITGLLLAAFLLTFPVAGYAIPQKGQPAPPFKVVTTSGQQVTLANYQGKVLILDFFASWCQPCKRSIPHLMELNRKYGKRGLQILGLSLDEEKDDLVDFITPLKLNYPAALADEDLQIEYGLRSIPTLFIISKKGIIADKYMGLTDQAKINVEITIKRLLAE